jgi:uncharacterized protein
MSFARRIVIDTGVLVSAAIRPASVPALAFEKALLHFDVCVSGGTLVELEAVFLRRKFNTYATLAQRKEFLNGYAQHVMRFDVKQQITDCADPKDNKFVALAHACEAELILASDPHLTGMHPWRGIPILPPAAFLVGVW